MAQKNFFHALQIGFGLIEAGHLPVKEEIFLHPAQLQDVVKHVVGEFQKPQAVADFPVDLETERRENQHRQQAEQESQDDLAPNLKGCFLHNLAGSGRN
jgi:hypothetical protein